MKVYLYYYPEGSKSSNQLASTELDILPQIGQGIRYCNLDDFYEDGTVRDIQWDLTDEGNPNVTILVVPIE